MKTAMQQLRSPLDGTHSSSHCEPMKARTWEQVEGSPLPLGATWMEEEQAFNFAICAEHAESVTLLFYAPPEVVVPAFVYRFDFLRNKSGHVWHCRIPIADIGECRYYAYSVAGEDLPGVHSFDPQKVLLDPYAKAVLSTRV
jgi:isoamylase